MILVLRDVNIFDISFKGCYLYNIRFKGCRYIDISYFILYVFGSNITRK